ncbi:hypothetical protein BOTBODRAFT_521922 [Botryobasidium botryosum FD-172 SS1]|uniref:Uncharacterized protein n=1 Tax=Botryobasidium botryosum (strain FD-172 SS1) TaxID=930990 RepID=A0A067MCI9_BOTB1|nr:hypothetical protein BOTBODRAFT_521922 [Botryobasidium botryosum FD-172 SS1]
MWPQVRGKCLALIIDYFHVDKPINLEICTLVCRGWIAPSRSHRLHNIRVHQRDIHVHFATRSPLSTTRACSRYRGSREQLSHNNPAHNKNTEVARSPDGWGTTATVLLQLENLSPDSFHFGSSSIR